MTPAEELTAAADRLDALIAEATPGPWMSATSSRQKNSYALVGAVAKRGTGQAIAVLSGLEHRHGDARYIAAMNPDVGRALAALLRRHGQIAVGWTDTEEVFPEELRLARAILGTREGT